MVVLALMLSFTVSPAAAGGDHAAATAATFDTCDGEASAFNSLDRLAESSIARGDTAREPSRNQQATKIGSQRGRGSSFRVTVPTWFHIVHHADGTGNVSDHAVRTQLQGARSTGAATTR